MASNGKINGGIPLHNNDDMDCDEIEEELHGLEVTWNQMQTFSL